MPYIKRLLQKIKYNSILRILHDGLVKAGINITLFYLVEEGMHLQEVPFELNEHDEYTVEFLKEDDLNLIADIPERLNKKENLLKRIKNGSRCLLFKRDQKVIGYAWFNLCECDATFYKFSLKENEAYLFDAYVLMEYRGKRIAPFLRYQCYKELQKLNKTTLYSISDFFNNQSIRFKKKLNAKFVSLNLYVNLFSKFSFSRELKKLS